MTAIDRSRRFLNHLESERLRRGLNHVETIEIDLDDATLATRLPPEADGAWCRWVFAFVRDPRALLTRVASALRPGGTVVIYEYFNYSTWRLAPRSPALELFVSKVMETWRASGGEMEVGLSIPRWLGELGFSIKSVRPIVDVVGPANYIWQWPKAFVGTGVERMGELGSLTAHEAVAVRKAVDDAERDPYALMITPGVVEIIATYSG